MAAEKIKIPLEKTTLKGSDWVKNVDDTQYVWLTDGGDLSKIEISKFGKGKPTEPGEGPGGNDQFHIDLSGFDDDFSITIKSMDDGDTFFFTKALGWENSGTVYTIKYLGSDGKTHKMQIDVQSQNGKGVAGIKIACFAAGTMIDTIDGQVAVEALKPGDPVICSDGVARPIRWVAARKIGAAEMDLHPEYRPVRIRKGALAADLPDADLVVSPQHRILLNDWRAALMFGQDEVLVPAVHLINDRDIMRDHAATEVTYYHFMFDQHQIVWSNGLQSESFYPAEQALLGVEAAARAELFALFPALRDTPAAFGPTCRQTLKAHEAMAMLGA